MGIKTLSNEEEKQLTKEYLDGASIKSLMLKYNFRSKKSIADKVKKHCVDYQQTIEKAKQNRKGYNINFELINNEFIAYFVGLMLSDGYIQDDNKFGLQLIDEDCISFISKITNKSYKKYSYIETNKQDMYRIIFSNSTQVKYLERYGIIKNKSLIIPAPKLYPEEEKYIPYILRGIIDGDGCIYKTSNGSVAFFIITGSFEFAQWIKHVLENKIYMKDIHITTVDSKYYRIETALQSNLYKLIALVYDKEFGMNRKYITLREMFRDYNKDNPNFYLG